jgi:type III restriction enzyme
MKRTMRRTDLVFPRLWGTFRPSCIIEFTATPARKNSPSNVLHRVSAAELKAAEMIKLPLRVITRHPSQADQLLSEAVTLRTELEQLAGLEGQQTGEYIRPILLIQANRVDDCEPLREKLVADFGFVADEVKISVGSNDELPDGNEINSPTCKVRCIITVQKLREGWDCPFAYVLCSLKETRSATAIEQIVGRVLRLPNARLKQNDGLNCSYVLSLSGSGTSITDVLSELRDALENHGFTTTEAQNVIIPMIQGTLSLGFMPQTVQVDKSDLNPERAAEQVKALGGKVRIDTEKGAITIVVPLDEAETEQLTSCVKSPEAKERIRKTNDDVCAADAAFGGTGKSRELCPYEQRIPFRAPLLAVRDQQELFEFESTVLLEQPWKLSAKDASLDESYNPLVRPIGAAGTVDVGKKGELKLDILDVDQSPDFVTTLHQQLLQLGVESDWTTDGLVAWLDRHIGHSDIPMSESAAFLSKVVRGLLTKFGIEDIGLLAIDRYRLRLEIEQRIEKHRQSERKKAFQKFLLPQSELTVTDELVINFANTPYEPSWVYEGGFKFKKHYYGPKPGELLERTPEKQIKEEFRCAQFIDNLKEVKFWVRNLSGKRTSFRLQTSNAFFYPDFVCQLADGRILVVEYKGGHLWADAEEKRSIGAVWEERSNGTCLFVMPTDNNFDSITAKIAAK